MMNKRELSNMFNALQAELTNGEGELQSLTLTKGSAYVIEHHEGMPPTKHYRTPRIHLTAKVIIRTEFSSDSNDNEFYGR